MVQKYIIMSKLGYYANELAREHGILWIADIYQSEFYDDEKECLHVIDKELFRYSSYNNLECNILTVSIRIEAVRIVAL